MAGWNSRFFYTCPFVAVLRNQSSMLVSFENFLVVNFTSDMPIGLLLHYCNSQCTFDSFILISVQV